MTDRFERAMKLLAVHEGGYADHPEDPGGATMKGVTQRTYDAWRKARNLPRQHVRQISDDEVTAIYRAQYWDAVRADDLPPGVGYAVFDAAVNSGPAQAARWLQRAVGATVDGVVGVETLAATKEANPSAVIDSVCDQRLRFMRRLRHYDTFKIGWERRVSEVGEQALTWASTAQDGSYKGALENDHRKPGRSKTAQARGKRSWLGMLADMIEAIFGGRHA